MYGTNIYGAKKLRPNNKTSKPITAITAIKLDGSLITSGNTLIKLMFFK